MFKRIYYNNKTNRISLWETVDGKSKKVECNPAIEYYVPDTTGKSDIKDIYGNPVILQKSKTKKEGMSVKEAGIKTSELTLGEDIKFLQKRYSGKNLSANMDDFQIATVDIEVESPDEMPKVEEAKHPINLITVHLSKSNKTFTFGIRPYNGDNPIVQNYHYCADEKLMLERFIDFWRKSRIDIATGWFSKLFDFPYLINRAENLGIDKSLSPLGIYRENSKTAGYHVQGGGYTIAGISILDGMDLYKNFVYTKRESYSLQAIGMLEVGEGKKDYEGTINNAWETDWDGFVEYNVQDVLLTKKINDKKKFIELTVNFCYQALIPFDKIFSSISLVTGYMVRYLHDRNLVFPDLVHVSKTEKFPGAYVMAKPGFYKYLVSFDVASMYPHMIMMFGISPETLTLNPDNPDNHRKCPLSEEKDWDTASGVRRYGGIYYNKEKDGVLSDIVSEIFNARKRLKTKGFIKDNMDHGRSIDNYDPELVDEVNEEGYTAEYYDSQQMIRKILINSMYGVLGNEYFNFYDINNAIAVTLSGQEVIKYLSNTLNNYMKDYWHKVGPKLFPDFPGASKPLEKEVVVLIDTDSNYVCLEEIVENLGMEFKDNESFLKWVNYLDEKLFTPFFDKILQIYADRYGVKQMIDFKREKVITQKFILAKKKYADEVVANEDKLYLDEPKISITGIEIVRTDTPSFCRTKIMNVVKEIFASGDKKKVLEKLKEYHGNFLEESVTNVAKPTGISDYKKYAKEAKYYLKNGLSYIPHCPMHAKSAMNYNYIVAKHKLKLAPITNGTKMKYAYVMPNKNEDHMETVGFIGEWPKEFDDLFVVDMETQWNKTFQTIIQRFWDVMEWGNIKLEENSIDDFIEF